MDPCRVIKASSIFKSSRAHGPIGPERNGRGFALTEALIALVILSVAMMAIYQVLDASAAGARRLARSAAEVEAEYNALEVMAAINPMLEPNGRIDLGPYAIDWRAAAVTEPRLQRGYPRGDGLHHVALYDLSVRVVTRGGDALGRMSLRRVGHRRVGTPPPDPEPGFHEPGEDLPPVTGRDGPGNRD